MKKIWICMIAGLLGGCLLGRSKPAEVYTLNTIPATEVVESVKLSINVAGVQVPKYMDRPQMVVKEKGKSDIKVLEKSRWVEPLTDIMPRVLADDLSSSFPNSVIKQRTLVSEKFDYSISVDLTQLDIVLGNKISMVGWWALRKVDGQVLLREKIDLSAYISDQYADVAKKQSELVRRLADLIGEHIKTLKKSI